MGKFAAEESAKAKGNAGGNKWFNGGKFAHGGHWGKGNKGSQGSKNFGTGNQGSQGNEGSQREEDKSQNTHNSENKGEKSKPSEGKEERKANENNGEKPESETKTSGEKTEEGNSQNPPGTENKESQNQQSQENSQGNQNSESQNSESENSKSSRSQQEQSKASGNSGSKSNSGSENSHENTPTPVPSPSAEHRSEPTPTPVPAPSPEANSEHTGTPSPSPTTEAKGESGSAQGKPSGEGPRVSEESMPKTDGSLGTNTEGNFDVRSQESVMEIEGKKYAVFKAIKQTLSADGTIIKEEIRIEAVEILPDMEMKVFQNPERVKIENEKLAGQNVKATITVEEIGGLKGLNPEVRERIEEGLRSAFKARTESNTNEYNVKVNNGGGDRIHGETVPLSIPIVINERGERGQPIEGSWEEVADDMYRFAKGFAEAPIEIAKESKEIIEIVLEYGTKPTEEKVLEVIGALAKLDKFNKEYSIGGKFKFLGANGWKLVKGIWAEFVDTLTTPEKQGRAFAETVAGFGIPRVLKSVKAAGKVLDEITDLGKRDLGLGGEKTCPKKKIFDEPDIDAEDLGKKGESGTPATKVEIEIVKAGTDAGGGYKHWIDIDADLLKREIIFEDDLNHSKLRRKFDKHGEHFGMEGKNFNKENAELFKQKIRDHINDLETIPIAGKYTTGGVGDVVHFYNPKTKINVMKDMNGNYVSGWELSEKQQIHLKNTGKLGGN